MKKPFVFISYRRNDEGPSSRFVKAELDRVFGNGHVFMDLDNIRKGDNWKDSINENIQTCDCLIVIIGKNWLQLHDEYYVRRLDKKEDWVRKEIEIGLRRKIKIIPLLLGTTLPPKEALPVRIRKLLEFQAMSLSALTWHNDISALVDLLCDNGFKRKGTSIDFPNPKGIKDAFPLALTDDELEDTLKKMNDWEITHSPIPGKAPKQMQEISKKYTFNTFEDAIQFMAKTSPFISEVQHHPRWENIWNSLMVHLSTWDIGHKISKLDIDLAIFLDKEYKDFYKSNL